MNQCIFCKNTPPDDQLLQAQDQPNAGICNDCVRRRYQAIENKSGDNFNFNIKNHTTLYFHNNCWYLSEDDGARKEIYRSTARDLLLSHDMLSLLPSRALCDVIKKDKPPK